MQEISDIEKCLDLIFDNPQPVLPEFEFKHRGNQLVSSNALDLDGNLRSTPGKVTINKNFRHWISDFRINESGKPVLKYIEHREHFAGMYETVAYILTAYNQRPSDKFDTSYYEKQKQKHLYFEICEAANFFFVKNFHRNASAEAEEYRKYIGEQRKYPLRYLNRPVDDSTLLETPTHKNKLYRMDLGYHPSPSDLALYLTEQGFQQELIDVFLGSLNNLIGNTHRLSIPLRNNRGYIDRFTFRTIDSLHAEKYGKYQKSANTRYTAQSSIIGINDFESEECIAVEGVLDAMHLKVLGRTECIALDGARLNETQIAELAAKGIKRLLLCLDNDATGQARTVDIIYKIINSPSDITPFVISLPAPYKDPDEYLINEGIENFNLLAASALLYWKYLAHRVTAEYEDRVFLSDLEKTRLLDTLIATAQQIASAADAAAFIDYCKNEAGTGIALPISSDVIEQRAKVLLSQKKKQEQQQAYEKLLQKATQLSPAEGLQLIKGEADNITLKSEEEFFKSYLIPKNEDYYKSKIINKPDALKTGYNLKDFTGKQSIELEIPTAALTIVAGRTSHGKTALLMNLLNNLLKNYPGNEFHFFTYEEDETAIFLKLMNLFINMDFKDNNQKYLYAYYKKNGENFHNRDFLEQKDFFVREYIETGKVKIHYTGLLIHQLTSLIKYICGTSPATGAVFIDYIQMINNKNNYGGNKQLELQDTCNRLKDLSVETGIPIILGAQFNREVVSEDTLDNSKLRQAGDIEQTANMIISLWNGNFTREQGNEPRQAGKDEIFIKLTKNRDGQVGIWNVLEFNGNTGKIDNKKSNYLASLGL